MKDEKIIDFIASERKKAEKGSTEIILIESILNEAIKKLQLFLCLPYLLTEDAAPLAQLVGEEEAEMYARLMQSEKKQREKMNKEDYDEGFMFYSYNDRNLEVLFNDYNADPYFETSDEDRIFYGLLNKLFCKPKVVQVCELLSDPFLSDNRYVLKVLKQLKTTIINKMNESPMEEQKREKELSDMVQYTFWAKDELAIISRKFNLLVDKEAKKMEEKCRAAAHIQECTTSISTHGQEMAAFLGRTSENKMVWERKKSELIQENLTLDCKKLEAELDQVNSKNVALEKKFRVKRFKIEAQLVTILKKYDTDVKERDTNYKDLLQQFNEEYKQLTDMREQCEIQAVEYYALMDEKEEFEEAIWEEKLYSIQKRIAARRIQRYYRDYVALCLLGGISRFKKKRKGKQKKAAP